MRCTPVLSKFYRIEKYTKKEHEIIFKPEMPMKLRNRVSSKATKTPGSNCIQEMFTMMACLKQADFNDSECTKEIDIFQKCGDRVRAEAKHKKELAKRDELIGHDLNTIQMNAYLKKFPVH